MNNEVEQLRKEIEILKGRCAVTEYTLAMSFPLLPGSFIDLLRDELGSPEELLLVFDRNSTGTLNAAFREGVRFQAGQFEMALGATLQTREE